VLASNSERDLLKPINQIEPWKKPEGEIIEVDEKDSKKSEISFS